MQLLLLLLLLYYRRYYYYYYCERLTVQGRESVTDTPSVQIEDPGLTQRSRRWKGVKIIHTDDMQLMLHSNPQLKNRHHANCTRSSSLKCLWGAEHHTV